MEKEFLKMKDLVTITTRITKELKDKILEFSKKNKIKGQTIHQVALENFLESHSERESEISVYAKRQLEEIKEKQLFHYNSFFQNLNFDGMSKDEIIEFLQSQSMEYERIHNKLIFSYELYEDTKNK